MTRTHRRLTCAAVLAALCLTGAGQASAMTSTSSGTSAGAGGRVAAPGRGAPGQWTKISTGPVEASDHASLLRVGSSLQVVYAKTDTDTEQLGHTTISSSGTTTSQSDILPSPWVTLDDSPILLHDPAGLRVVFGGNQSATQSSYWTDGRMYTATSSSTGASWALPMQAVGESTKAYGSYGTGATTLADGTPIAAFPLNGDITWHVGTDDSVADQSYHAPSGSLYSATMVRSGSDVWLGWYANGSTAATNGTFVKQIYPTVGATTKVPGSSVGAYSLATGRVAMVARPGGGVVVAYCAGYPSCTGIHLWRVGTTTTTTVPGSKGLDYVALGAGPAGRLWVAWQEDALSVKAVRTSEAGFRFGPVRSAGLPMGSQGISNIAIDGALGRGDIVVNVGDGFWHTQVLPGLTLGASPASWNQGKAKTVTFTVADAGDEVAGAVVKVDGRQCTTAKSGSCQITFPAKTEAGKLTAKATDAGYAQATKKLKVK